MERSDLANRATDGFFDPLHASRETEAPNRSLPASLRSEHSSPLMAAASGMSEKVVISYVVARASWHPGRVDLGCARTSQLHDQVTSLRGLTTGQLRRATLTYRDFQRPHLTCFPDW